MCHSWIIIAHISLGHLECHWKSFGRQMDKTCQLLQFLNHQPSAPTQLISTLQVELNNINDIHNSCKPNIISAIYLMNTDPSFNGHSKWNNHLKRSLLPFLGNAYDGSQELQLQKMSAHLNSINTTRNLGTHHIHH